MNLFWSERVGRVIKLSFQRHEKLRKAPFPADEPY